MLWELAIALNLCGESNEIRSITSELLFGFPHLLSGFTLSLADVGYICISTVISVFLHEFGHALAATRSVVFYLLFNIDSGHVDIDNKLKKWN
jgi:S2P endopeptidase